MSKSSPAAVKSKKTEGCTSDPLKVFISYSRRDSVAADAIVEALEARGFEALIDRRDLPFGEKWMQELSDFIRTSDSVVWLVSPQSVSSQWCRWELEELTKLKKRLVPLMIVETARDQIPWQLNEVHILPAEGLFDHQQHLATLAASLETDRHWIKEHTRLADRARDWIQHGRASAVLLRGAGLTTAEQWRERVPRAAPRPSEDVLDYIAASRRSAVTRRRWLTTALTTIGVIIVGLGSVAWFQQQVASEKSRQANLSALAAEEQRRLAAAEIERAAQSEKRAKEAQRAEEATKRSATTRELSTMTGLARQEFERKDYERAIALAAEVITRGPTGRQDPTIDEAENLLFAAVIFADRYFSSAIRDGTGLAAGGEPSRVVFSPTGTSFVQIANNRPALWRIGAKSNIAVGSIAASSGIIVSPSNLQFAGSLPVSDQGVSSIFYSQSGDQIFASELDGGKHWRNAASGVIQRNHGLVVKDRVLDAAFSEDGRLLALVQQPPGDAYSFAGVNIHNTGSGALLRTLSPPDLASQQAILRTALAAVPKAAADADSFVQTLSRAEDAARSASVQAAQFLPGSTRILTLSNGGTLSILNATTGALLAVNSDARMSDASKYKVTIKGKSLLLSAHNAVAHVLDVDTLKPLFRSDGATNGARLSDDGRHILFAPNLSSTVLTVIDLRTGATTYSGAPLNRYDRATNARIADWRHPIAGLVASDRCALRLAAIGSPRNPFPGASATCSPDGSFAVLSVSADKVILLPILDRDQLVASLPRPLRCRNVKERQQAGLSDDVPKFCN